MATIVRYYFIGAAALAALAPALLITELAAQTRADPAIRQLPQDILTQAADPDTPPPPPPRAVVSLAAAGPVTEGEPLRFRITVSPPQSRNLQFGYVLSGETSALQRPVTAGRAVLIEGQSSVEIALPTRDDAVVNGRRRIVLSLAQAPTRAAAGGVYRATGVILDNDVATAPTPTPTPTPPPPVQPVVTLGVGASVVEGGVLRFPVRLDRPARDTVAVSLAISDPQGAAGGSRTSGLRIAAGSQSGTLAIRSIDDDRINGARLVTVQLLRAQGAVLGRPGTARAQVTDNDVAPTASATPADDVSSTPAPIASEASAAPVATAVPSEAAGDPVDVTATSGASEAPATAGDAALIDPAAGGQGGGGPPPDPSGGRSFWTVILAILGVLAALAVAATLAVRALLKVRCSIETGAVATPLSDLALTGPELKISAQATPGDLVTSEIGGLSLTAPTAMEKHDGSNPST